MPKKTLALILVLAIVTIGLVILALKSTSNQSSQQSISPSTQPTIKTAQLYFEPTQLTATADVRTLMEIPVYITSGASQVSGAEVDLQYDPTVLTDMIFVPATSSAFFDLPNAATTLSNNVDPVTGTISYVVSIAPNTKSLSGTGQIGSVKFHVAPTASSRQTSIVFSPDSAVTSLNAPESILKSTTPVQILITRPQNPIRPATTSATLQ
jgi:hypothetical protein